MRSPAWSRLLLTALALASCRADPSAIASSSTADPSPPAAPTIAPPPAKAAAGEDWNAAQIDWQPYAAGLARAKAEGKPVCLVFYTGWCPHCKNYSRVFEDPQVVARAKSFVMIHLNADDEGDIARKYAPDGGYIPRTFFLGKDGVADLEIHAPRPQYRYFYDEKSPAALLAGMDEADRKLRN